MPDDYLALADLQNINNANLADVDVSSLYDDAPALQRLAAVTASYGDRHYWLDYTGAPVTGFRSVNDGREHDSSIDTVRNIDLKIQDASFTVDVALARTWKGGAEDLIRREAVRHLRAAMFDVETQLFNGTTDGDAAGFLGLCNKHSALGVDYTIGAGGTTALSSVYLVRSNPDETAIVAGMGGMISIDDTVLQRIDGSSTGHLGAYFTNICAWFGLQTGSLLTSSVRIANIDAGSNTVTDDLIYSGLKVFPAGRQPNLIFMNRRSLEQLRSSRTATNATGTPAPRPTEVEGIPIVVTDGILSAETVVS